MYVTLTEVTKRDRDIDMSRIDLLSELLLNRTTLHERYMLFGETEGNIHPELRQLLLKLSILSEDAFLFTLARRSLSFAVVGRALQYLSTVTISDRSEIELVLSLINMITGLESKEWFGFHPNHSLWYQSLPARLINNIAAGAGSQYYLFGEAVLHHQIEVEQYDDTSVYGYLRYISRTLAEMWLALTRDTSDVSTNIRVSLNPSWYW